MNKQKAYREFIELATEFLTLTEHWSPARVSNCINKFIKEDSEVTSTIALPPEWDFKFERLRISAHIVLLTKKQVTNDSFAIVKKNLTRATIFLSKDGNTYLRLNNLLIQLI